MGGTRKGGQGRLRTITGLLVITCFQISTAAEISNISPHIGSEAGGTRLTMWGSGFMGIKKTNEAAAKLYLVSLERTADTSTEGFLCETIPTTASDRQISCTTTALPPGYYYARAKIEGVDIPVGDICKGKSLSNCRFTPKGYRTPTIWSVTPQSIPVPAEGGVEVVTKGKIFTEKRGTNVAESRNGRIAGIPRIFFGGNELPLKTNADGGLALTLYEKTDGSYKDDGEFTGIPSGKYVGCVNISYIVDAEFGRSKVVESMSSSLLRLSRQKIIYMIQTFAQMKSVSPASISPAGGLVKLTGLGFSEAPTAKMAASNPDLKPRILFNGVRCDIIGEITEKEITCKLPPLVDDLCTDIANGYPGSSGVDHEMWTGISKSYADLPSVRTLDSTGSGYQINHLPDPAYYDKDETRLLENFAGRMRFYFDVPWSGVYMFFIKCDDRARLYMNINGIDPDGASQIASCPSYAWTYDKYSEQASGRQTLEAGKLYYMEMVYAEGSHQQGVKVAAKFFDTTLVSGQMASVAAQKQTLELSSTVVREIQTITLTGYNAAAVSYTKEEIKCIIEGADDGFYQLGWYNVYTEPISVGATASDIKASIDRLPMWSRVTDHEENVSVEKSGGQVVITVNSERGGLADIQKKVLTEQGLTVTCETVTQGTPSGKYLTLYMGAPSANYPAIPSPPIHLDATEREIKDLLTKLFESRCSQLITKPSGKCVHYDFDKTFSPHADDVVRDEDAFSGTGMARYPDKVYEDNDGVSLTSCKQLCFAYKGVLDDAAKVEIKYKGKGSDGLEITDYAYYILPKAQSTDKWMYRCLDMKNLATDRLKASDMPRIKAVKFIPGGNSIYVDEFMMGSRPTFTARDRFDPSDLCWPAINPGDNKLDSLSVAKTDTVWTVTFIPQNCSSDFALLSVNPNQVPSSKSVVIGRTSAATPRIRGSFDMTVLGTKLAGLKPSIEARGLVEWFGTVKGLGRVQVDRSGTCHSRTWEVTFLTRQGNLSPMVVDAGNLLGHIVTATLTNTDGYHFMDPIPGEFTRTYMDKPQVMGFFNDIPTKCSGDCSLTCLTSGYPTITAVSPTSGNQGISITLSVANCGDDSAKLSITMGTVVCTITSVTTTTIVCTVGSLAGAVPQTIDVHVSDKGFTKHPLAGPVTFTCTPTITDVTPLERGLGGGGTIVISGTCFPDDPKVTLGTVDCPVVSTNGHTRITCKVPGVTSQKDVTITVSQTTSFVTKFSYKDSSTPLVTSVNPTVTTINRGDTLSIAGSNFGEECTLTIAGQSVTLTTQQDTLVTGVLPVLVPGVHDILLYCGSTKGNAVMSTTKEYPTTNYLFRLDNMFPRVGSLSGGTDVTLTGDGFVDSGFKVTIGTHVCKVTSVATTKVVCRIDDTSTTHTVLNKGYNWSPDNLDIYEGDTVQWGWDFGRGSSRDVRIQGTSTPTATSTTAGLFDSKVATSKGAFAHTFNDKGLQYYWAGPPDDEDTPEMRGVINVKERAGYAAAVMVTIDGKEAIHDTQSGVSDPTPGGSCPGTLTDIPGYSDPLPTTSGDKFQFVFDKRRTPEVTDFDPEQGSVGDTVSVTGKGFSTNACENEVKFGDIMCTVTATSPTDISCNISSNNDPSTGIKQKPNLRINNRGNAMPRTYKQFVLIAKVENMSPVSGSQKGGTLLTFTGSGFLAPVVVTIGGFTCTVISTTYTEITCNTASSTTTVVQMVVVTVRTTGGQTMSALCAADICKFEYRDDATPKVTKVTIDTTTITGATALVTIEGSNFGTDASKIVVKIGGLPCTSPSLTDGKIVCRTLNAPVGVNDVTVHIKGKGKASSSAKITSSPTILSVSPTEGSEEGGTRVIIIGNGFEVDKCTVAVDSADCVVDNSQTTLGKLVCTTSAHAEGTDFPVHVSCDGTTFPQQKYSYKSSATPTIETVTIGDDITLAGKNFGITNSLNKVTVGDVACVVKSSTGTQIVCTLDSRVAGSYPVQVHVTGKGLSKKDKMVTYALALSGISASSGSKAGGQKLTLTGSGFDQSATVSICGQDCPRDVTETVTATTFVCTTPASDAAGATELCSVTMTLNHVTKTLTDAYTYMESLTSEITSVTPGRGGTAGGTTLAIGGTGFGTDPSKVVVMVEGTPCTVSTVVDTAITCETGAHLHSVKSYVKVEVDGNGKAKAELINSRFEYIDRWSSKFTWGNTDPPVKGDLVKISKGQTILLDTDTPILSVLIIEGGTLIFDEETASINLHVEYIIITAGGKLQIGTEDSPYKCGSIAIITMHGHLKSTELPLCGAKVLCVICGTVDFHGCPTHVTWVRLQATAAAGSSKVQVQVPVEWNVGNKVVVATTGDKQSQDQSEVKEVKAISADKTEVTFTEPLEYTHIAEWENINGQMVEMRGEVGLLSHNIIFNGNVHDEWDDTIPPCPAGFSSGEFSTQTCFQGRFGEEVGSDEFGAHILHHALVKECRVIGRYSYVELTFVGQAFRLGRYPIHFHMNGDMAGSYVRGCSIYWAFNRAVNIHGSHYILLEHLVIYNIMGGALFFEDGIEYGNIWQYNLAVFVRPSSSLLNDDVTPAAYWITNPNNTVWHNAAAGCTHFGYWYRMKEHPEGPSFTTSYCPRKVPIKVFSNNTVHSTGQIGLWVFQTYTPMKGGGCNSNIPEVAMFESLTAWACDKGAECVECGAIMFKKFVMINNHEAGIEFKLILQHAITRFSDTQGPSVRESLIVSHLTAITSAGCTMFGLVLPYGHGFVLSGIGFVNFDNSGCAGGTTSVGVVYTRIQGKCSDRCGGFETQVEKIEFINTNRVIGYAWIYEGYITDLDGSMINMDGYNKGTIIPTSGTYPDTCVALASSAGGFPASVCPSDVIFHRFAFNEPRPDSLNFKAVIMTNDHGSQKSEWRGKRITHKEGWMVVLVDGLAYTIVFEDAEQFSNISYTGQFDMVKDNEYVSVEQTVKTKPDRTRILSWGNSVEVTEGSSLSYAAHVNGNYLYDAASTKMKYLISGKGLTDRTDIPVTFQTTRCYYERCISPSLPGIDPPATERPARAFAYHDTDTWPSETLPAANDDVVIPGGQWIYVDRETLPVMDSLTIDGTLEFDHTPYTSSRRRRSTSHNEFKLQVKYIVIIGRLIVGWKDRPFLGKFEIVLTGTQSSPEIPKPGAPPLGSMFIAVFGALELHGKDVGKTWTTLAVTMLPGQTTMTLSETVAWAPDDEIIVAPTSYYMWEFEVFTILSVSGKVVTVKVAARFVHIAHTETVDGTDINMKAGVGLLTHNVRICGAPYTDQDKHGFGGRVLVGASANGIGYARLSFTEFCRMGQEGHYEEYDPRMALSFLDLGTTSTNRPSSVTSCSFHHLYSPAIAVIGTHSLRITHNVMYRMVYAGIVSTSADTYIGHNLLILMIWEGGYQDRRESQNFRFNGLIDVITAIGVEIVDNHLAASERVGVHYPGENCASDSILTSGNVVYASLVCVGIFSLDHPTGSNTCRRFSGFTIFRCRYYGLYYNHEASLEVQNVYFVDNLVALFPMIFGPSATAHILAEKYMKFKNSIVVARSSIFDCALNTLHSDFNTQSSGQANPGYRYHVGMVLLTCTQGKNKAPEKPFMGIMAYNALSCLTSVEGVKFSSFTNQKCSVRDRVFTTNKGNEDGTHPMRLSNSKLFNVDTESKFFFERPDPGKINPSDCVDMSCDGKKQMLVEDLDGTFLGTAGAVLGQSDINWDGESVYGIGDYRIPKTMLTRPDGTRIPATGRGGLYQGRGITRSDSCTSESAWQAYVCQNTDYEQLVIESMDSDSETRRLSPVALLSSTKFIDLLNGPQDHGWCAGYTCQKRLSTFTVVVGIFIVGDIMTCTTCGAGDAHSSGTPDLTFGFYEALSYDLYFTSTNPQQLRLTLLNSVDTQAVVVCIYYAKPNPINVYHDDIYVAPKNAWDDDGILRYLSPGYEGQYIPTMSDPAGSNYFDWTTKKICLLIKGKKRIDIKTLINVITISMNFPPMTLTDFFVKNLVINVAEALQIPIGRVKIARVVSEASGRKRRSTTGNENIILQVGDDPPATSNGTANATANTDSGQDMNAVYDNLVNNLTVTNPSTFFNLSVEATVAVSPPLPDVSTDEWTAQQNDTEDSGLVVIRTADRMSFLTTPVPLHEGARFIPQPKIQMLDRNGDAMEQVGSVISPWKVTATLEGGDNPSASIMGTTIVPITNGVVEFTDLYVSQYGNGFSVKFTVTEPQGFEHFNITTATFNLPARPIIPAVHTLPAVTVAGRFSSLTVKLIDNVTKLDISDIAWRNHTWNVTVEVGRKSSYNNGTLGGTTGATFNPVTGLATFDKLKFTNLGTYLLHVRVTSDPSDYDLTLPLAYSVMSAAQENIIRAETKRLRIRFDINYASVVNDVTEFKAAIWDYLSLKFESTLIGSFEIGEGSIIVTFTVEGSTIDVNSTIYGVCSNIEQGDTFTYGATTLTLSSYLDVNGVPFYGITCGPPPTPGPEKKDTNLLIYIIIACIIAVVFLVASVIFFCLWKYKVHPKTRTDDIANTKYVEHNHDDIEGILFREKSFLNIAGAAPRAPISTVMKDQPPPYSRGNTRASISPVY